MVYCNNAAARLTRYSVSEMLGRSCRFLQGPDTEDEAVGRLSASLRAAESASVELTNYRKDGSQFRNALFLQPVHDSCGACRYVIGLQADAAD
uniref:PAS domain-containing protein n=1 Tax=Emiliania huxleyi (strain CCMP1516) TaxID=280463 RepID=A0A0D3KG51_EMIH1